MFDYGREGGLPAGKRNAPSFIYEILYGETKFLSGRTEAHVQKTWRGISVDEHIPTEALDQLDAIEEIELRASCEGSGPERPTFLVVRFPGEEDFERIKNFVAAMNAHADVKCGAGRGNMGRVRVGMTAVLWYEKNRRQFAEWWLGLPTKIRVALAVIESLSDLT
ncbi:MAG: hypothetical protein WCA08_14950 [Desulfoferrobacter sp.]